MEKYILEILLKKNNVIALELLISSENKSAKKFKVADKFKWNDKEKTSQNLLKQIDKFLRKNKLQVFDLQKVKTKISDKQKFTLARIVQITAETLNYSLETIPL